MTPFAQPNFAASIGETSAESLALRAQKGDRIAFAELVRRFEPRLRSFIVERVRCHADASDIAQTAFLKAWLHIGDYSPKWKFSTWLFVIGHRLAISHLRARKHPADPAEIDRSVASAQRSIRDTSDTDIWARARETLQDDAYTVIRLRYVDELSISEIAQVVDRSEVAVRVTLFRARRRLAELLPDTRNADSCMQSIPMELNRGVSC